METILIADDHEIVRHGIRIFIESMPVKYRFIEASTCETVMQILSNEKVDYTILDMQLEDGNYLFNSKPVSLIIVTRHVFLYIQ